MSEHTPHVLPLRVYFGVFFALLVLTGVTTWVAFMDFGYLNTLVAMTIAVSKALLVLLYFMHLRYSERLIWLFAFASLVWFLILVAITMADYDTRILIEGW